MIICDVHVGKFLIVTCSVSWCRWFVAINKNFVIRW